MSIFGPFWSPKCLQHAPKMSPRSLENPSIIGTQNKNKNKNKNKNRNKNKNKIENRKSGSLKILKNFRTFLEKDFPAPGEKVFPAQNEEIF